MLLRNLLTSTLGIFMFALAAQTGESPIRYYDSLALQWSVENPAEIEKGWKHTARWMHFAHRQLDGNGRAVSAAQFDRALRQYRRMDIVEPASGRANSWSPVGPFEAPEPISDFLITGTGRINTIEFHPTDRNVMWIGAGQGGIWKTENGARNWFPLGDDLPVMRISDIEVNRDDPDEIYLCLGDYAYLAYWLETADVKRNTHFGMGLYRSTDGGNSWQPTGLTADQVELDASLLRRAFIDSADNDILIAAGFRGVMRSEDRGETWSKTLDELIWDIERDPTDASTLYATSGYVANLDQGRTGVWKSTDFGQSWTRYPIDIPEQGAAQRLEIAISPTDPDILYIISCNTTGGFYACHRSDDGGKTWDERSTSPNILHWTDGVFSNSGQGTYDLAVLVDPEDPDKLYAGGVNCWMSEDGGLTWSGLSYWTGQFGPSIHADHHYFAYNDLDDQFYVCHDGGISRTEEFLPGSWDSAFAQTDYEWPTKWEHLNNGMNNMAFYRLGLSEMSDQVYAGSQDMGTFLKRNDIWTYHTLGDGMECLIHPVDDDILIGSSQFGNLFLSTDGGTFFSSIPGDWGSEQREWTTPFELDPSDPNTLYVAGANVWQYTDEDGSVKLSEFSEFPISAFSVAPSNPDIMYAGKRVWYGLDQPGEIWRRDETGVWTNVTVGSPADSLYVTYLEVDDDDPMHVWATFAGFSSGQKVYESRNGGTTWINISSNLPNLPANCIVQHPGADYNPVYVGMDRGVYYRNDTMDTWMLYNIDLPNVIVSELEIREETQELYIATFGRGIWMNSLVDQIFTSTGQPFELLAEVTLSPNPSPGIIHLNASGLSHGPVTIEMVDATGRMVKRQVVHTSDGRLEHTFDAVEVSGIYYVRMLQNGGMLARSVIIEN